MTMNPHSYRILRRIETQGVPPADSYWARAGLTRAELDAIVASRRHLMAPISFQGTRSREAALDADDEHRRVRLAVSRRKGWL